MAGESGVSRSIINEIHCSGIQGDQIESEGGVTGSIIDELHSFDLVKMNVKVMVLEG